MTYFIKVKNILGKDKQIQLISGEKYVLKNKDEKIIGKYSDAVTSIIFKLLKQGFEVSKILEENIKDYMKIETYPESPESSSKENSLLANIISDSEIKEKPKKKRGRPPKNK